MVFDLVVRSGPIDDMRKRRGIAWLVGVNR
jgi:hypothetical protein